MRLKLPIILLAILLGCKSNTPKNLAEHDLNTAIQNGFQKVHLNEFLKDKLLISKKSKLKNIQSLNIKGHRFYDLDENGNITATYDVSNNYQTYQYSKQNKLLKVELKQHTPAKTYHTTDYQYDLSGSLIRIIKTSLKDEHAIKTDTISDEMVLAKKRNYFTSNSDNNYYINHKTQQLITYEDNMIFCCGNTMNGKNKLTYYLNSEERIDSLLIVELKSKKTMQFEYIYK